MAVHLVTVSEAPCTLETAVHGVPGPFSDSRMSFSMQGGDPLDFKFGEALRAPLLPLSRKEPLADQLLRCVWI